MAHQKGTTVTWQWGNGEASGTIKEVFKEKVTRTIDGNEITRNGSDKCPAYLIKQDDGQSVLKLDSEVEYKR